MSRMIGLHERVSTSGELLLGRDVVPEVGQRVLIASRYANDVWARDESGGRNGSVVKLIEGERSARTNHKSNWSTSCLVQWDTLNGKSWPDSGGSKVSACYMGLYRCGANGHYQLAIDPHSQPAESEIEVRKKRARDKGTQSDAAAVASVRPELEASELIRRRQDISVALEQVGARVKEEMERVLDTCDDWINEAELALAMDGSGLPVDGKNPEVSGSNTEKTKAIELSEEERLLGKEIDDIWKVLNRAEIAFKRKVEADELASRALDELKEFVFPSFLTFCVAEIPELARGLEKICESGIQDLKSAGNVRRHNVPGYKTPAALLMYDPDADPEEQESNLQEFRNALKEVTDELHSWKVRTGLPPGEESKPFFVLDPKNPETNPPKRPLLVDSFMTEGDAPAEELAGKLEELAQRPEAVLVKEDMDKVVGTLRNAAAAFSELLKWTQDASDPKNQSVEQAKQMRTERDAAIQKIMEAFGKGVPDSESGDKKSKDGEKKTKEKGKENDDSNGARRHGPSYDPEDNLGAVLLGMELETEQSKVRNTVQRILLRLREVQRQKEIQAQFSVPLTAEKEAATDESGDHVVRRHLGARHQGGKGSTVVPGMKESSMYNGLLRVYEMDGEGEFDLNFVPDGDLVRARKAINEAGRLMRRCDVRRVREGMEALGEEDGGIGAWLGARVADLEPRIGALDAKLSHVEDSTLERARSAVTRAELLLLGPVRGELMGDAGEAARVMDVAKQAMEMAVESIELREQEALEREREDAKHQHKVSVASVRRLLDEGQALLLDAETILDQDLETKAPLDALLAYKSAEDKCARATISPQHVRAKQ